MRRDMTQGQCLWFGGNLSQVSQFGEPHLEWQEPCGTGVFPSAIGFSAILHNFIKHPSRFPLCKPGTIIPCFARPWWDLTRYSLRCAAGFGSLAWLGGEGKSLASLGVR